MSRLPKAAVRDEALRLRAMFEATGAAPVDPAILQPAATLLDLYGEDIRARAYVTADPLRGEQMLRPDFTVPVVQEHMDGGAEPARYTYSGEVFRKQENDETRPNEYFQVGLELFDGRDPEAADADVFASIAEALQGLPVKPATGDIGITSATLAGLTLSDDRRAALMRHLWRPRRFRALIDQFAGRKPVPTHRKAVLAIMAQGGDPMQGSGIRIGLRSETEIRARLDRLAKDAVQPPLPASEVDLLDQVTGLKDVAPVALERLRDVAVDLPTLSPAVARLERRFEAMAARGIDVDSLPFETSFGRTTLEYYDGFVFGFSAIGRPDLPAVAIGGRYDALTKVLGRGAEIPAVGGIIRAEVALHLREKEGAA
ncbi:ATP phosphoribosyltransferase regulatory subunit [Meridianimarinicoccus aquatilis]|uniref:ATP phosphoribosyltransferase regulatory subunit n=1 Tax=Meridianimarinicoccus aquatilis TaxID=2552766 RepID=A0A4R6B4I5_9RHOB|nr:ATP phosphoribosyltransferase regulatory subunit [Fluviibacterium aquatile]QIE41452.1 ATP phosphoribosyltransferase regulatory subunit [Rhodobacteraceae bacterium SC52]TDL91412.1 ATP phosphoribosyltransferase regulatory subunit [Fluviibacterium aquatile]